MRKSLCDLKVGETAVIEAINTECLLKQRLHDIGIIKGSKIKVLHQSPSKNPKAYFIKGCVIALRNNDARHIIVQSEGESCG